jgi:aryl-alcohol dehydrogenase-like predicted oxidoreductase
VEDEILPAVRELGIGFVPYSPLGRGFLTGRFPSADALDATDHRRNMPRFQDENFQKNLGILREIERLARAKGVKPGQLALAWALAQGDDIVPIPGTKRRSYLEENVAALDITLTPSDLEQISRAVPKGAAAGDRYPARAMAAVNR